MNTNQYALRANNLCKKVISPDGELELLRDITLDISPGESVAVVGVSGSGKSTLLGLLAGLDTPTSGSVHVDGVDLFALDEDGRARVRAEKIGFIFQSFQLLPNLTALENVMLPLDLSGRRDATKLAESILQRTGLGMRMKHYPHQLSGGEQQRVAIARAFVSRPKLLFADEPTGNLDRRTGEHIISVMFQLNEEEGTTLVLVTHDDHLAARCRRRVEIEAGQLKGTP